MSMRALFAALALATSAVWVAAQPSATATVTGEVISLSCYFQNKANVGRAGAVCAQATVKWEGNPAGLLTQDGKVYQIAGGLAANNNKKVVPHLGRTVTVTGQVYAKDGMQFIAAEDTMSAK